MLKDYEDYVQ